jgi:NAD(P)-dependent dehydrogenase (short-subunit alcohol dehydrogenase family)
MYSKIEFIIHSILAIYLYVFNCFWYWLSRKILKVTKSRRSPWPTRENMIGKMVIVTGANTGVGRATAEQLAKLGATVILGCRNESNGLNAEQTINNILERVNLHEYPHSRKGRAIFMKLDLSDLHDVLEFTQQYRNRFTKLDILINNAGLNIDEVLPNGLKQLFQVNYLGHYLLYRALEDLMIKDPKQKQPTLSSSSSNKQQSSTATTATNADQTNEDNQDQENKSSFKLSSSEYDLDGDNDSYAQNSHHSSHHREWSRVVNLSSVMHHCGHPNFKLSALTRVSSVFSTKSSPYDDSKLYLHLLTMCINRRWQQVLQHQSDTAIGPITPSSSSPIASSSSPSLTNQSKRLRGVLAVSVNPGAVLSDIWRYYPFQWLIRFIFSLFFLTVQQGCATSVFAAAIDETIIQQHRFGKENVDILENGMIVIKSLSSRPAYTVGGRMIHHPDVPYVIPYAFPWKLLAFEIIGPYAGPRFSTLSLPTHSSRYPVSTTSNFQHSTYRGITRGTSGDGSGEFTIGESDTGSVSASSITSRSQEKALMLKVYFHSPEDLADQLWKYSAELCKKILLLSGARKEELTFLK